MIAWQAVKDIPHKEEKKNNSDIKSPISEMNLLSQFFFFNNPLKTEGLGKKIK